MKNTLIAMTSALLLTGTMSFAASAQSYYDQDGRYPADSYDNADDNGYQDADRNDQGDVTVYDRYQYRQNGAGDDYDYNDNNGYDDRNNDGYDDRYSDYRADSDRDGVADRYDRYDNLRRQSWDRNGNGMNDRYEQHRRMGYSHRYDRQDHRRIMARHRYHAGRYYAPRGYRYVRYNVGSRLPMNYYGTRYYVDHRSYGLAPPPRGYRWNRVGNDVYLVSINNGIVRQVVYSLFY